MKFWSHIGVLFFVAIVLFIALWLVYFAINPEYFSYIIAFLGTISYHDIQFRLIIGLVGGGMLVCNYIFANSISDRHLREKTIAFDNPSGRVSVSLSAMEDLVKRLIAKEPEVKEGKVGIRASKKGLDVVARLIIKSSGSIPELTSRLQEKVKKKIQTTIGIEDPVTVKVHVAKIIPDETGVKPSKPKSSKETKDQENIPFQGYRP